MRAEWKKGILIFLLGTAAIWLAFLVLALSA
jgi:hypothetical protein